MNRRSPDGSHIERDWINALFDTLERRLEERFRPHGRSAPLRTGGGSAIPGRTVATGFDGTAGRRRIAV